MIDAGQLTEPEEGEAMAHQPAATAPREARIVIIDDDALSVMLLEKLLTGHGFTTVSSATDAEAGLRLVLDGGADLLLLDLHMPGLDGFAIMRRLWDELAVHQRPAVLMLTSDAATDVKEQALALGARDFLTKPFPPVETILRVENLLEVRLLTRRLAEENVELEGIVAKRAAELAAVTHAAADAIVACDSGGRILSWNRGAEATFGWPAEAAVGRLFTFLVPGRLRPRYTVLLSRLATGEPETIQGWRSELVCLRHDGSEFAAEVSLSSWEGDGQRFYAAVVRDITERRRAEEAERDRARLDHCVSDVRLAFTNRGSLADALGQAAGAVVKHLGAALAGIWLLSAGDDGLELAASAGMHSSSGAGAGQVAPGQAEVEKIAARQEPLLTNSIAAHLAGAARGWAERHRIVAFAGYPLVVDGRLVGVVSTFSRQELSASTPRLLEAVASELAAGIARKRAAEALRAEQVFLASMLQSLQEGILASDAEGNLTLYNEAMAELQGKEPDLRPADDAATSNLYHPDGVTPVAPADLPLRRALRGDRVRDCELVIARPDQRRRTVVVNGQAVHDDHGKKLGAVVAVHDVTERKQVEAELARHTFRDSLTGLPNRALFMDRLAHALSGLRRGGDPAAVFAIGIDNFKLVNDSLGHQSGDELLVEMGSRLAHVVGRSETVARLGGDVFGVLCEQVGDEHEAMHLAQLLNEAIAHPLEIAGHQLQVTASIGITLLGDPEMGSSTAQSHADSALSRAKTAGRGSVELFGEDLRSRAMARLELEHDLRRAIARQELVVHYQPEVRLADGRIVAAEALLRWDRGAQGLVPPCDFIPVAEETRLIVPIGQWVLDQACRSAAAWARANPEDPVMVAVNLSARQLTHPALVAEVGETLATYGIDPALICLEITESVLMEDAEASIHQLRALKALGIRLAIDDFGTGYSSLSYLKRFPVDFLKVDRSFVEGLGRDPEDTAIVSAIVKLARALGMAVIAEGVETELQLGELQRLECEYSQGFFWSKALTEDEVGRLLAARAAAPVAAAMPSGADRTGNQAGPRSQPDGGGGRRTDDAVAVVAHELRAPLTVISGYAELLAEDLEGGEASDSHSPLQTIMRNARHMATLIDTLADVGAVDSGRLSLKLRTCEVTELVSQTVADIAPALGDHPVEVSLGPPGEVDADTSRLRQVITNLLTNAAKFSPTGTPITVHVEASGRDARVSVVDRGPGVPPEAIGDVFRKFARVDRTRPGRGLGLYLSRSIARAHGGDLSCRKATTGGAEFVLEIPLTRRSDRQGSPAPSR